jgi:uncharacterized membrane protein YhaH (DUF805 family)
MPTFWIVFAGILIISSTLNAYQVVVVDDPTTRILRASLSLVLLLAAALCVRRWLSERDRHPR